MASPSPPNIGPSTSTSSTNRASTPRPSVPEPNSPGFTLVPTWTWSAAPTPTIVPTAATATTATRSESSRRPSGVITAMTSMAGSSCDGGTFDDASSVTLQDKFPWHEVGIHEHDEHAPQRIPSMIFPALLHTSGDNNYAASPSPPRQFSISSFLVDDEPGGGDESGSDESEAETDASRYSITEKGKVKVETVDEDDSRRSRSPSPQFCFPGIDNSVEDWVMHNRPILQEYADRQTSLPLGRRLEVSIDEPSDFVVGSLQLLVNRDRKDCTDRSRQLGPQLIENFVNIDRWAKEYFRSRHGMTNICNDVPTLLTIVMNDFYEGLVQLIDRLVEFALEQMRFYGRTNLAVEDFSFGYDFRMSQDLPFCVETSSRIREPLPIHLVKVRPGAEPVTTHSGRQVRPTKRAQEACEQAATSERQNKGKVKGSSQVVKDKRVPKGAIAPPRQRKSSAQHCSSDSESDRTMSEASLVTPTYTLPPPRKTMSGHTKHRPLRPSSLGLQPLISPALLSSEVPSESSASASRASASASASTSVSASGDGRNTSGRSGSDSTAGRPPSSGLKIVIPRRALSKRLSGTVTSSCESTTNTTTATTTNEANTKSMAQTSMLETSNESPVVVVCGLTTLQMNNLPANSLETVNEGRAHGCLFDSVSSVVGGGQGLEVWPRSPSGPSVGDNTDAGSGGRDGDSGRLRGSGLIELTLNAGSISGGGSTSATIPKERASTERASAKGNLKGEGENTGEGSPGAQVRGTGDASSHCGDRLDGIDAAVDDTRDEVHPASGNIDTRGTLPLVPPSDPGPGSGSGRLRRRKRKLDECED